MYEQVDGVAMGSLLGPLVANAFLCSTEEKLERDNKLPQFYKSYVDDTLGTMPNIPAATAFLSTLNECHPSSINTFYIGDQESSTRSSSLVETGVQGTTSCRMMIDKIGCNKRRLSKTNKYWTAPTLPARAMSISATRLTSLLNTM